MKRNITLLYYILIAILSGICFAFPVVNGLDDVNAFPVVNLDSTNQQQTFIIQLNESMTNVNNSQYWDGHPYSPLISQWTNDVPYLTASAISGFVPYIGATTNVDLGYYDLYAGRIEAKASIVQIDEFDGSPQIRFGTDALQRAYIRSDNVTSDITGERILRIGAYNAGFSEIGMNVSIDGNLAAHNICYSDGTNCAASIGEPLWTDNSSTVARIGNCPDGFVVQNTTFSGVQCVPETGGLTFAEIVANIGNWSNDKINYALKSYVDSLGNWSADKSGLNNLSLSQIAANIGNWSADKSLYSTLAYVNSLGNWSADKSGLNNLSLSQIAANIGNWTADKSLYSTLSYVNSLGNWSADKSGLNNLSLSQIAANIGNWSNDKINYALKSYVDSLGNWSADKSSYVPYNFDGKNITGTGNITANYYFGNGSQLTGIIAPGDNLGNHIATKNLNTSTFNISSDYNTTIAPNSSGCLIIYGNTSTLAIC